jgi:hypothetical protein
MKKTLTLLLALILVLALLSTAMAAEEPTEDMIQITAVEDFEADLGPFFGWIQRVRAKIAGFWDNHPSNIAREKAQERTEREASTEEEELDEENVPGAQALLSLNEVLLKLKNEKAQTAILRAITNIEAAQARTQEENDGVEDEDIPGPNENARRPDNVPELDAPEAPLTEVPPVTLPAAPVTPGRKAR